MDFNSKEMEMQRLWEEEKQLVAEINGETRSAEVLKQENFRMVQEIERTRDENNSLMLEYDQKKSFEEADRQRLAEYESRLRYANDVIQDLQNEGQAVKLDLQQVRAFAEAQARTYREVKANYELYSQDPDQLPSLSAPRIVFSSTYYQPRVDRERINLLTSTYKPTNQ